jgi:hypothetical protein
VHVKEAATLDGSPNPRGDRTGADDRRGAGEQPAAIARLPRCPRIALQHYGLWAIGLLIMLEDFGIPVPGETILIAGPIYAGAGRLHIVAVGVVGFIAAIIGENIGFAIGTSEAARWPCGGAGTCSSPGSGWTAPNGSSAGTAARSS